jgi:hypothetical protein
MSASDAEGAPPDQAQALYEASPIKRRIRATKAEMQTRRAELIRIVDEVNPCTVRQVFYQASVRGLVDKTEEGYGKVQRELAALRLSDEIPYDSIVDNTRWIRKERTFRNLDWER